MSRQFLVSGYRSSIKATDSPSIALSPQIKALRLNLRIQIGQSAQETLNDFPRRAGSQISSIGLGGIDHWVPALDTSKGGILHAAGKGVD